MAVALAVFAASTVASTASLATASPATPAAKVSANIVGRQLYRTYCGQCHALAQALSAGFGSNTTGISRNGGPSFNELRVSYASSVNAVTEPTGGHEKIRTKINPKQLNEVAAYIARITIHNPIPALSTDG
ncbi:MAG TPA: cytochrome c [Gaiellaceae bacterium]|nr:cytochrome c [Gaiellaceae bacterium]